MGAFNARSLKHLAVKKAHGVPIAKLKLIKNRGQIMPPTSSMKFNYYFIFITPAVWHILPHKHAQSVAMIIPTQGFHFAVLAQHVKSQFFHCYNVADHSVIRRRRIKPIRPITLIQHACMEIGLSIQKQAPHTGFILLYAELTHAKIALYAVFAHVHLAII